MQDVASLIRFGEDEIRARGGVDVAAVLEAALSQGLQAAPDVSMQVLTAELLYRMDLQKAAQLNEGLPPPRPYTVRWYQDNADEMVASGSTITVRQACFCLAALKLRGGMTRRAFDDLCRLLSIGGFLSGDTNFMPRCVPEFCCLHNHCTCM